MYSMEIQQIALREVFSDKQEKLRCLLKADIKVMQYHLSHSSLRPVVSDAGLSSFMSHCWVCLSGHSHYRCQFLLHVLRGVGLFVTPVVLLRKAMGHTLKRS